METRRRVRILPALPALVMMLVLGAAGSVSQDATPAGAPFGESEALDLARRWAAFVSQENVAELEKLLDDAYTHIHATALIESKAQFLEAFRNGSRKYDPITFEDVVVRVFGGSAVVTGKFTLKASVRGKTLEGVNRFSLVLAQTPDGGKAVSYQATAIPQQQ